MVVIGDYLLVFLFMGGFGIQGPSVGAFGCDSVSIDKGIPFPG